MSNDRNDRNHTPFSPQISRRHLIQAGIGAAGIAATPAIVAPALARTPAVTSAYIPIVDSIPIPIAYEKGFFKEAGLRAERPTLMRDWAPLLEAFTSNQVLLTHILLFQVLFMRYEQQLPIRSFAFNHLNGVAMLGGKGITDAKQLGGKVVGCPTWWAPHTLLFQMVLRQAGLKPVVRRSGEPLADDEVAFRVVRPPDMPNALRTGAISGAVVSEPFGAVSEVLADATLLRMSGDVWHQHPCCQSVMMQPTIDRDPAWSQAVATAIARASAWCESNREEMVDILSREGGAYFPVPRKIVARAVNKVDLDAYGAEGGTGAIRHPQWNVTRLSFNPYPYRSAFELAITLMKSMVVDESVALSSRMLELDPSSVAEDVVAYDLIRRAIDEAGGIGQFHGVDPESPFERRERIITEGV